MIRHELHLCRWGCGWQQFSDNNNVDKEQQFRINDQGVVENEQKLIDKSQILKRDINDLSQSNEPKSN